MATLFPRRGVGSGDEISHNLRAVGHFVFESLENVRGTSVSHQWQLNVNIVDNCILLFTDIVINRLLRRTSKVSYSGLSPGCHFELPSQVVPSAAVRCRAQ